MLIVYRDEMTACVAAWLTVQPVRRCLFGPAADTVSNANVSAPRPTTHTAVHSYDMQTPSLHVRRGRTAERLHAVDRTSTTRRVS